MVKAELDFLERMPRLMVSAVRALERIADSLEKIEKKMNEESEDKPR